MAVALVTGGAGFIGSHLVDSLLKAGHQVRILDDFSTGRMENLDEVHGYLDLIDGSILDAKTVRRAAEGAEWIFHFAALPSVQRSVQDPVATHAVCATGTLHVLCAAREARVRRVIYAASSSAYGGTPGILRGEQDAVCPLSPYAAAKLAGEEYCKCFTATYGLETVRLRFFNIFGPRQGARSHYSAVIPLFIAAMARGQSPTIHGDGLQSRDFTFVGNAVKAALQAATAPSASGQVYNVGNGESTTVLALVQHLNRLLGTQLHPVHVPSRPGDVRHSLADISKARRELNYRPAMSFLDDLKTTVESFKPARD